ncbi:MAG: hypothetical protein MJ125_00640 [Clostridia bacterium]|nr:hypothetical protein [Clostridia bacterium]
MKKVISLLLSLVLVSMIVLPALAAEEECSCGFSPLIYVGPLGCADIVRDAGTENEQKLWKTDTGFFLSNAKNELGGLVKGALLNNPDEFGDALIKFVNDSFGDLALDNDGNSKSNVTVEGLNVPSDGNHGINHSFYFNYDFRLDPYIHAERLNEVIQQVKCLTKHSKVQLKASSMGGVVLAAYLEEYGRSDVEKIICQCCPLWGTAVAGELFNGLVELNADSLRQYAQDALPYLDGGDFLQALLYSLTEAFRVTGVWDGIINLGNKLVENLGDRVFDECLIPIFGSMPGIWAFVPAEYYEGALSFMKIDKSSGLYEQIARYRTAQSNVADNLQKAMADGVRVYIFCGYDVQRTPLVTAWHNTSDGTVDTKYASLGATCADDGSVLEDEYISSLEDKKYVSPDKCIDASTCALPDCTWFNKGWLHCNGQKAIDEFYNTLLQSDEQLTVFSNEKYPQFLKNDDHAETLTPVKGIQTMAERFKEAPSLLNFVKMIIEFFTVTIPGFFRFK